MLRAGVLSPHSKVIAQVMGMGGERPSSVASAANVPASVPTNRSEAVLSRAWAGSVLSCSTGSSASSRRTAAGAARSPP